MCKLLRSCAKRCLAAAFGGDEVVAPAAHSGPYGEARRELDAALAAEVRSIDTLLAETAAPNPASFFDYSHCV